MQSGVPLNNTPHAPHDRTQAHRLLERTFKQQPSAVHAQRTSQPTSPVRLVIRRRPFARALATRGAQRVERRRSKSRSARSSAKAGTSAHGTPAACAASLSVAATSQPSCTQGNPCKPAYKTQQPARNPPLRLAAAPWMTPDHSLTVTAAVDEQSTRWEAARSSSARSE